MTSLRGNRELADVVADRDSMWVMWCNPHYVTQSLDELEKCRNHPKFVGVSSTQKYYRSETYSPAAQ